MVRNAGVLRVQPSRPVERHFPLAEAPQDAEAGPLDVAALQLEALKERRSRLARRLFAAVESKLPPEIARPIAEPDFGQPVPAALRVPMLLLALTRRRSNQCSRPRFR